MSWAAPAAGPSQGDPTPPGGSLLSRRVGTSLVWCSRDGDGGQEAEGFKYLEGRGSSHAASVVPHMLGAQSEPVVGEPQ